MVANRRDGGSRTCEALDELVRGGRREGHGGDVGLRLGGRGDGVLLCVVRGAGEGEEERGREGEDRLDLSRRLEGLVRERLRDGEDGEGGPAGLVRRRSGGG